MLSAFRFAARHLRRTPAFTALAVITLALGIGASTAVFAFVNALVFRPAGAVNLDDVYAIQWTYRPPARTRAPATNPVPPPTTPARSVTMGDFRAFQARPPEAVTASTAVSVMRVTIRLPGRAERVMGEAVAGDYGPVFGLVPRAGRLISASDDVDALANVVISDRLWRQWFGADLSAVGRTLTVDNRAFTIVGVGPRGYQADVIISLGVWRAMNADRIAARLLDDTLLGQVSLRLRPGAPQAAAEAAYRVLFGESLSGGFGRDSTLGWSASVRPARETMGLDRMLPTGLTILTLSLLVLLAACANLANLLYVRGATRAGEVAVRLSLGGQPRDILTLFLAETTIIAGLAVALGLALSTAVLRLTGLASSGPAGSSASRLPPRELAHLDLTTDVTTVLYAVVLGVGAALTAGFVTAWRASRTPPLQTLAAAGVPAGVTPRGRGWRVALVAVQVTAAVLLLMGTALWIGRLVDSVDTTVRFQTSAITAARIDLSLHDYTQTRGVAFFGAVLERARTIPGVDAVAIADGLPGHDYVSRGNFTLSAEPKGTRTIYTTRRVTGRYAGVSEGFIDALGIRLRRGRRLRSNDDANAPLVAVICESLANRLWPDEDPIGQRLMFGNEGRWRTVVGVSADPITSLRDTEFMCASCVAFVPWQQAYRAQMLVLVRSDRPPAMVEPLRAAIRDVNADVAIQEAAPLDDTLLAWARQARAAAMLIASLGVLALVIASLGVYGIVSFLVSARTREFGIRLALGATPGRVIRQVLDQTLHLMLVGLLPAVLIASLGSRLLQSQIKDLMPNDIPTWIVVPILVLLVGLLAGYIPARRASRIEPTSALRNL